MTHLRHRYPNGDRGRILRQDGRQIVSSAKVAPHSLLREVGKRAKLWSRLASGRPMTADAEDRRLRVIGDQLGKIGLAG